MDMRMPNVDGIEATEQIAGSAWAMPVVVLSAYDEPQMIEAALAAGATNCLKKGVGPRRADRGDPRGRPRQRRGLAAGPATLRTRWSRAASTSARNSAGAVAPGSSSGCHSTPTANDAPSSSIPSTTPSSPRTVTRTPSPRRSGAW